MKLKLLLLQFSGATLFMVTFLNLMNFIPNLQHLHNDDIWAQNVVEKYLSASENGPKHKDIARKVFKVNLS